MTFNVRLCALGYGGCGRRGLSLDTELLQSERARISDIMSELLYDVPIESVPGYEEYLFRQNKPPNMCGRIIGEGETYFQCTECITDPTVIMCKECFVNSIHVNHVYKMMYR